MQSNTVLKEEPGLGGGPPRSAAWNNVVARIPVIAVTAVVLTAMVTAVMVTQGQDAHGQMPEQSVNPQLRSQLGSRAADARTNAVDAQGARRAPALEPAGPS